MAAVRGRRGGAKRCSRYQLGTVATWGQILSCNRNTEDKQQQPNESEHDCFIILLQNS